MGQCHNSYGFISRASATSNSSTVPIFSKKSIFSIEQSATVVGSKLSWWESPNSDFES